MGKVIKLMDFRLDSFSITKYEHEKSKKKKIKERRDALSVSLSIRKWFFESFYGLSPPPREEKDADHKSACEWGKLKTFFFQEER